MKKMLLTLAILTGGAMMLSAAPSAVATPAKEVAPATAPVVAADKNMKPLDDWSFFQIGFSFNTPSSTKYSNVYGIKTGQPISSGHGRVYGTELSWIVAGTDNIIGAQGCWFVCMNKEIEGVMASLACNYNTGRITGLQAGAVNLAGEMHGFQPGAVNVSKDVIGVQAAAIANVSANLEGAQFGLVNSSKDLCGMQASFMNLADKSTGFQLGFLNSAKKTGFQIGLINIIKDGWLPFFPLMNFSF